MTAKKTYDVHKPMHGEGKDYAPDTENDTREMTEADAAELVAIGALSPKGQPPVEREPGVRHTFGTLELEQQAFVPAISDPDVSDSRIEGRRSPARKG